MQPSCQAHATRSIHVKFKLTTLLYSAYYAGISPTLVWEQIDKILWSLRGLSSGLLVTAQGLEAQSQIEAFHFSSWVFPNISIITKLFIWNSKRRR